MGEDLLPAGVSGGPCELARSHYNYYQTAPRRGRSALVGARRAEFLERLDVNEQSGCTHRQPKSTD